MGKKVAFLIESLSGGGAERVISNLLINLNDNIERFLVLYNGEKIGYPYKGKLIDLEIYKRNNSRRGFFRIINNQIYIISLFRKIKKNYHPEITISFLMHPNFINILSWGKNKKIISVRNNLSEQIKQMNKFHGRFHGFIARYFYKYADVIVAVSDGVKSDLIENFGIKDEKIRTIYNPYDIELIHSLMNEELDELYQSIFNNQVIINAGSLSKKKGQIHLIKAFFEIKKDQKNTKLVFLGKGELEDEFRILIRDLNLENDVFFLGFQKNPFKFIRKSTIFVLSSLYEGFPNVLVEAMICGVPVISTDCQSGPREILNPNSDMNKKLQNVEYAPYGVLIPVCNGRVRNEKNNLLTKEEKIMANCIINLLKDERLRKIYSELGCNRSNNFGMSTIISQWEQLIFDV